MGGSVMGPLIALLPVRNGEADLPGWLDSARGFADAVIALDDGSTDRTAEILHGDPLVVEVLANPRRETYLGWDDAGNRNRLLAAAGERFPGAWMISLDADERLDPADARALRRLAEREGIPGLAYGFRVVRMIGSDRTFDRSSLWVYRLFAHEPGQRFPDQRLHFVPIPTSIPRRRWVKTALRIKHLASLTEERRTARFRKYEEADPDHRFQGGYENLLTPPGELQAWEPRRDEDPLLMVPDRPAAAYDRDRPVISAIVISHDDEDTIAASVEAVVTQECPAPFEVIVVVSGKDRTADIVAERFPGVRLIRLRGRALPGAARNAGLAVARGDYVSFPGSHVVLPPGSLAARVRAHEEGWSMVTGTLFNGNETRAGWAAYFLDHSNAMPGRPSGELTAAPAHCSYVRSLLTEVGGFPEDRRAGEDTVVNRELFRRGYTAYRERTLPLVHASPSRTRRALWLHQFRRGRGLGRIILEGRMLPGLLRDRAFRRRMSRRYVRERLAWTDRNVEWWGRDLQERYREVRRLVRSGIGAARVGAWAEILRPRRGKARVLFGSSASPVVDPEHGHGASPVRVLTTGYCPCDVCCEEWADGITALGVDVNEQVKGVAADLTLLPPWTRLEIPGYGPGLVDDTGSMMRASARAGVVHLDLRFSTHEEALRWGRRWVVIDVPSTAPAARIGLSGPDALTAERS